MFEKMGQSLAATGQYDVHVLGYPSHREISFPNVYFHPSKKFKRLSLHRLLIPFLLMIKARKLKPSIVIITTHELLFFSLSLKLLTGAKIVYDVRENYMRNIFFLSTFPILLRPLLALYVRLKEILYTPFISTFIFSDYGYGEELTFMRSKSIVIENKVKRSSLKDASRASNQNSIRLLFSGTLAVSTGVFTAIDLCKKLHAVDSRVSLRIIGYCAQASVLKQIHEEIRGHSFIQLEGGDQLVPHDEVMKAISNSHFGIISYPPNPSTRNTMPTKLFEYVGACLPILLIDYKPWMDRCEPYPAAITFNPVEYNADDILSQMFTKQFFTTLPGKDIFWENEAEKLIQAINSTL